MTPSRDSYPEGEREERREGYNEKRRRTGGGKSCHSSPEESSQDKSDEMKGRRVGEEGDGAVSAMRWTHLPTLVHY